MKILTKIAITSLAAFCVTTVQATEFGFVKKKTDKESGALEKVKNARGVAGDGGEEAATGARIL